MPTNISTLKTFAQQTRAKLISLITTKLQLVLKSDSAELRAYENQIDELRKEISSKTEKNVVEEVAYTWFNRVMALRFMDANGYNAPMIVSPAPGQTRPEILQDAMGETIDDELRLSDEDKLLPEAKLYRRLLIAVCDQKNSAMPFLFEHIADYTELLLPDDLLSEQSFVTDIRNGMSDEDCENVELMGWLYQFYIIDRKADAEIKKTKKGGLKSDEQAAATQLFTPHWVVRYMVENTLGKIWMTLHPESKLIHEMPYYIQSPEGQLDPIPEDIRSAADIRFIDPCMGSGHVLVYAFDLFTKMYEEEGEMTKDIPGLILTNNLFGIDIDPRCYQLASFALTMKARAYYSRYLRHTISPNVIALQNIAYETIASSGNWKKDSLMWKFEDVDTIGSLLKITAEECAAIKVEGGLFGLNQEILKRQAEYLSGAYHCVVTNPPYLGKGFGEELAKFLKTEYTDSKADTMVAFMERCMEMSIKNGKMAMINMHSWMFLSSYEKLRKVILDNYNIDSLLHLGPRTFDEISGEVVQNAAFVMGNYEPSKNGGVYFRLVDGKNCTEKEYSFLAANKKKNKNVYFEGIAQTNFEKIPGIPIGYWVSEGMMKAFEGEKIGDICSAVKGLDTCDNNTYVRFWSEVSNKNIGFHITDTNETHQHKWYPYCKGGGSRKWYGLYEMVVNWENDGVELRNLRDDNGKIKSRPQNVRYYFKEGITWSSISNTNIALRYMNNAIFGGGGSAMFSQELLMNVSSLLNSKVGGYLLKVLNSTLNFLVGDLLTLPITGIERLDLSLVEQAILISRLDWDSHETSWDFQTSPLFDAILGDIGMSKSQFNHSRMLAEANKGISLADICHTYTEQWQTLFMRLHTNEEELNRQFIEIYGLQDELTPDVPLNEITILQQGEISIEDNEIVWHKDVIIKQFISYLVGCYMGRYSIDKPGLIIASQGENLKNLINSTLTIDDDGIIPFVQEQDFFSDDMTERIQLAIRKLFGENTYYDNLKFINDALGCELREYLFKTFYADHLQMYQKRPIYWLFSSKMGDKKKKGYFKALVYMHRIEGDTLSKLHADYVHPYIEKVEMQLREAEDETTRDDLNTSQRNKALKLAEELKSKLREVHAFEQQLVEMASHRLSIDLDDGVKTNYPKFYPLVEPIKGLEGKEE